MQGDGGRAEGAGGGGGACEGGGPCPRRARPRGGGGGVGGACEGGAPCPQRTAQRGRQAGVKKGGGPASRRPVRSEATCPALRAQASALPGGGRDGVVLGRYAVGRAG